MKSKNRVLCAAKKYLGWRWRVVPVPRGMKKPLLKGWPELRIREREIAAYFRENVNIGILTGKPSGGLIDVDLDCPEALVLASNFLPSTGRIHGRESKPRSHRWYRVKRALQPEKFCDFDGTCLVELRSTGQQTIAPPSVHPSGERVRWERKKRSARVNGVELRAAVRKLAAAAIVARHWPERGSRNEAALALAGMLLRAGWKEEDAAAFIGLVASAAVDEEWKSRKGAVSATAKRLGKGKDVTGRPKLSELIGSAAVDRACEWLGMELVERDTHVSWQAAADWPKPLEKEALYGLAGDFVKAVAPQTEADPAGILVQFLVSFGNACGREPFLQWGRALHHTNLFCVLVGHTAKSRKGTAWEEVASFFRQVDKVWLETRVQSGLSSGEGMIWAVRDPIEKVKTNTKTGKTVRAVEDGGIEDKRLLLLEEEFASPLRVIRREGNTLSAVVRNAWARGNLSSLTKNSPARATDAHISIVGHITVGELLRELTANEGNNGFANRFLWVCVKRSGYLPFGGKVDPQTLKELTGRCILARLYGRTSRPILVSKQTKRLWKKKYRELSAGAPGLLGAITSRAEAQVLRLSLVYALLDRSRVICRRHLRAALAVWRYCDDSARHIFGDKFGDLAADQILSALRESHEGLSRTEIRELFSRNRSEAEISRALKLLLEHGLAKSVIEETRGRPLERWIAKR